MKKVQTGISILLVPAMVACAARAPSVQPGPPTQLMPLAAYTQRPVLVLPLQQMIEGAGRSMASSRGPSASKDAFNYELRFAFGEAAPPRWIFAPQIIASSGRNIGLSADPTNLAVESLADRLPEIEVSISESLRTQIRQIVALTDARYVLLPVWLRHLPPESSGMLRATLRVVLIDARLAQVRWAGDISSGPSQSRSRASASVASNLAQLAGVR